MGNFWGRKLSRISRFCGYSQKFSPWNLGVWCLLAWHERSIHESFLHENRIFVNVFSFKSFPLYGTEYLDFRNHSSMLLMHSLSPNKIIGTTIRIIIPINGCLISAPCKNCTALLYFLEWIQLGFLLHALWPYNIHIQHILIKYIYCILFKSVELSDVSVWYTFK